MVAKMLAVDGGGSQTTAVVVDDDGHVLGYGKSGCSNHQVCGREVAFFSLQTAVSMALRMADLEPSDITHGVFALAGLDREKDFRVMEGIVKELSLYSSQLIPDTLAGLSAGSPDMTGIVLISGNGSNAYGRNTIGETIQIGGLGWWYGDAAGGRDLAREAFRNAVRSFDGREVSSILTKLVPQHMGYPSMDNLIQDMLDQGLQDVPITLAEALHLAAEEGDELAIRILGVAGEELGKAGMAVYRHMQKIGGFHSIQRKKIPVVLIGSVLQKGKSQALLRSLQNTMQGDQFTFVLPEFDPVFGAVFYGWQHLKVDNDRATAIRHFVSGSGAQG